MAARKTGAVLALAALCGWLAVGAPAAAQSGTDAELHQASVRGVRIGMELAEVIAKLDPLAFSGKESAGTLVLLYRLEDGSTLEVTLRAERVTQLYLWYKLPRAAAEFQLPGSINAAGGSALATDPRIRRDYETRALVDETRLVWMREEKEGTTPVEVGFLSASRAEHGARFSELVEYKFVTLPDTGREKHAQATAKEQEKVTEAAKAPVEGPAAQPEVPATTAAASGAQGTEEDHAPSIRGIRVGMSAQQVLDRLGRMPDSRRDEADEVVVKWQLAEGGTVEVHFRGERVWQVGLQFKELRPATDLWLVPLSQAPRQGTIDQLIGSGAETGAAPAAGGPPTPVAVGGVLAPSPYRKLPTSRLTARDPRWMQEYKPLETIDKRRVSWTRLEEVEEGYRVEIRFVSVSKDRQGDRFQEWVEYKFVAVNKDDLAKFDQTHPSP